MDTVRPLALFLGVSGPTAICFSPTAFAPPTRHLDKTTYEKVSSRLSLNFKFFSSNYALVAMGVTVVVSLLNPGMLLSVAFLWGLWWFHRFLETHSDIPLTVSGKDMRKIFTAQRRASALTFLTLVVIIFQCLMPMITVVCLSGVLIVFHALMRDPKDVENSSAFRGVDADEEYTSDDNDDERVIIDRKDVV